MKKLVASLVVLGCISPVSIAQEPAQVPSVATPPAEIASSEEKVLLQFREQDWGTALGWLAEKLKLNLDWKTLPEDKLSLSSSQEISLEAAEDMFNMQLLSRGFVLLKRDGVLRLVSLTNLDITLVPRVNPEELATLPKHSVARVSFPLEWMIAEEAVKELQPLLSPYGKASPIASANRLEVVDAVVNLREFYRLLTEAEKTDARRERVAEFRLQHRRVEDVAPKVRQLLGLPADTTPSSTVPTQLDIEEAKLKIEALKQMGKDARELVQQDRKTTVFVAVNEKENSLLVNAPPNKIEIVRQTVEAMDKPVGDKESLWETMNKVKVYDVTGFDPIVLQRMTASLQAQGTLNKDTRVHHEPAYNRMVVFAPPADQVTIAQLMESFRAEKRTATVLQLSNVEPSYAAKAVSVILKAPGRPSQSPGIPSDGVFQVEADTKNNRLLLWATPAEMVEVREFLARLGETFQAQAIDSKLHVIEMHGQDTLEVTQKLKRIWNEISDTPLLLDPPATPAASPPNVGSEVIHASNNNTVEKAQSRKGDTLFVAAVKNEPQGNAEPSSELPNGDPSLPPVRLMQNGNGDLVVLSKDPVAAETARRLIDQLLKDKSSFRSITLKHAQAFVVRRQLETMLANAATNDESKFNSNPPALLDVDPRTNRLIIQNADERQWKMIQESVEILDQANSDDEKLVRERVTYRFQHRKAAEVAKALQGVYADLLQFNDRQAGNMLYRSSAFNQNIAATTNNPEYQGLMAFSVDEQANLLIISAPKYLIEEVLKLVESMDTAQDGNAIAILSTMDLPFASDTSASKAADNIRRLLNRK